MKLIDVQSRNAKELETIKRKIAAAVKKAGCSTGEIRWSNTGAMHHVEVENDGRIADDCLADVIRKSPYARLQGVEEHKGSYMWSADHYVRPVSVVSFAF